MKDRRAYSLLTIKSINEDQRIIVGMATTPEVDRYGDIVDPKGAEFSLPMPFLWQHDPGQPIGNVTKAKATKDGIEITAQIAIINEAGTLKDRLDEAWQSIKAGLVRGLSIGFKPLEYEAIEDTFGLYFSKWLWLELSAVTIAANATATITAIKSADRAASGERLVTLKPGVSGKSAVRQVSLSPPKPTQVITMNLQQQIKAFVDARAVQEAALRALLTEMGDAGTSADASQMERYKDIKAEIDTIDSQLSILQDSARLLAEKAIVVPGTGAATTTPPATTEEPTVIRQASASRGGEHLVAVEKDLPKGIAFARFALSMLKGGGDSEQALKVAKSVYPTDARLHNVIKMFIGHRSHSEFIEKANVAAALTSNSTWAGALIQYQDIANDFIEFLRPQTIIGQLPGLRHVPFKCRIKRQTGGGAVGWVGESKGKPLTSLAFDTVTLDFTKLAAISVLTDEVLRLSSPSAETIVRDELAAAIVQQMDSDFIDPANAGTSNVKPASITHGATNFAATGTTTQAGIATDILTAFSTWIGANVSPAGGAWIMSPTTAMSLGLMVNSLGNPIFPGMTINGGTFQGLPVVVSQSAGLVGASDGAHIVVLLKQSDILLADDGQVTVDASREASLEMSDAPSNTSGTPTGASLVSMFQTNSVAIRAERWVNWTAARTTAAVYITGVHWGGFPA